jgi:hypothetical protein
MIEPNRIVTGLLSEMNGHTVNTNRQGIASPPESKVIIVKKTKVWDTGKGITATLRAKKGMFTGNPVAFLHIFVQY